MTVDREWLIAPTWPGRDAAAVKLGISSIIAQVLHNRGIEEIEEARSFLDPKLNGLTDPEEYEDLTLAAETVAKSEMGTNRKWGRSTFLSLVDHPQDDQKLHV